MKTALKNIFEENGPTTIYATVAARLSATRYELRDGSGRTIYAESTDYYPATTPVIIQSGKIIGPGKRAGKPKVYEV